MSEYGKLKEANTAHYQRVHNLEEEQSQEDGLEPEEEVEEAASEIKLKNNFSVAKASTDYIPLSKQQRIEAELDYNRVVRDVINE